MDRQVTELGGNVKRQEIFDKVVRHLLRQNAKSLDADDECQYRAANGRKCAIGALVPARLYRASLEGTSVLGLKEHSPKLFSFLGGKRNGLFLQQLQVIHDDHEPKLWRELLAEFGVKYSLKLSQRLAKALTAEAA
jgi:hypothetical protein